MTENTSEHSLITLAYMPSGPGAFETFICSIIFLIFLDVNLIEPIPNDSLSSLISQNIKSSINPLLFDHRNIKLIFRFVGTQFSYIFRVNILPEGQFYSLYISRFQISLQLSLFLKKINFFQGMYIVQFSCVGLFTYL